MRIKVKTPRIIETAYLESRKVFRPAPTIELFPEEPETSKGPDTKLTCRECGSQFVFTAGERDFYQRKGLNLPTHCRDCRLNRERQPTQHNCAQCETKIEKDGTVYCQTCVSNLQIALERKTKKSQRNASSAQGKLEIAEARNEELEKSLYEAKQHISELELQMKNLNQDLNKAHQLYVASGWLEPALTSLADRLKSLEKTQQKSNQEVTAELQKIKDCQEHLSLWDVFRSTLPHRKNGAKK